MKEVIKIFLILLIFVSCQTKRKNSQKEKKDEIQLSEKAGEIANNNDVVDLIQKGITIDKLRDIYKNADFIEEPLFNYGIDGENSGVVIVENGEKLFFVWTKYDSDIIHEIIILSSKIEIDGKIKVGTTLEDYMMVNPDAEIELDVINEEYEYAFTPNNFYQVEFIKTSGNKVAEYDEDYSLKKILNTKSTIDRIRITKKVANKK